jgi:hydroxymethylbilane synthase
MTSASLRIATRKSPLALWQSEEVQRRLAEHNILSELLPMSTRGDEILDKPLATIGGKGLFIKELQKAMLAGHADLAVHSMKDVPADFPDGLHLAAILTRDDPTDAFVSNHYTSLASLPDGARVGTCSQRRKSQVLSSFPHLQVIDLRGNVNTRLAKLDRGDYDAIILACAGLDRLGMQHRITARLSVQEMLPACAQGAIGVECSSTDARLNNLLANLHDVDTADRVICERSLNAGLGGSCQTPIGGYATLEGDTLWLRAMVATPDGKTVLRAENSDHRRNAAALGSAVAKDLRAQGADAIINGLNPLNPYDETISTMPGAALKAGTDERLIAQQS